jgi:hypothetical protein
LDAGVKALLKELKGGIEAAAVGVIDGARGWLHSPPPESPEPPADGGPDGGGQAPAELGIPLAWIRRRSH